MDQPRARSTWDWYWRITDLPELKTMEVRYFMAARTGAANLAAGSISVALATVLDMRSVEVDITKLGERLQRDDHLNRESTLAGFGGAYLGPLPRDAMAEFAEFAIAVASSVQPAANAVPGEPSEGEA
jgi:hypothetical protein